VNSVSLQNPNHKTNTSWALLIKYRPSHEAQKDLNHKKTVVKFANVPKKRWSGGSGLR
jgi:hypothetical protein